MTGGLNVGKKKRNPSKAGVSAASVEGNAGPGGEFVQKDKKNNQNNQYKKS